MSNSKKNYNEFIPRKLDHINDSFTNTRNIGVDVIKRSIEMLKDAKDVETERSFKLKIWFTLFFFLITISSITLTVVFSLIGKDSTVIGSSVGGLTGDMSLIAIYQTMNNTLQNRIKDISQELKELRKVVSDSIKNISSYQIEESKTLINIVKKKVSDNKVEDIV